MWGLWAAPAWGQKAFISTKDQGFHPSKVAEAENGQCRTRPSRPTFCPPPLCTASWWPASTGPSCLWLSDELASGRRLDGKRREQAGYSPAPSHWTEHGSGHTPAEGLICSWVAPSFSDFLAPLTNSFLSCPFRPRRENAFPSTDCTFRPALTRVKVPSVNLHAICFLPGPCPVHCQTKKPTTEERTAPSHQNLLVLPAVSHSVPHPSPAITISPPFPLFCPF